MILKKLRLVNFQSHANTVLDPLPRVTVLVGPNGSGKSALLEGLRVFSRLLTGPVAQAFGVPPYSFNDQVFRGAQSRCMEFHGTFSFVDFPSDVEVGLRIGYSGAENIGAAPSILGETVSISGRTVWDRAAGYSAVEGVSVHDVSPSASLIAYIRAQLRSQQYGGPRMLKSLAERAGRVVRYRLEPRQLSLPSLEPDFDGPVRIGYEGDNLATSLHWMREYAPDRLNKIVSDVRTVIPKFQGVGFNYVGADRIGISLEFEDARRSVLAANASSGTLLLLGLVTLLNGPTQPDIACIEEPETGLTPDAVRLFLRLLVEAADSEEDTRRSQFLFSSHSPFVLVDAWRNGASDRSFIKRTRISGGATVVEDIESILRTGEVQLSKGKDGSRDQLSLKCAEEVMCGRFLPVE